MIKTINFEHLKKRVSHYTGIPYEVLYTKTRKAPVVLARYIISCILDYSLKFSDRQRIEDITGMDRCLVYHGWDALMNDYLFEVEDRDVIDPVFMEFTGKTFVECQAEMYESLYKKKGWLYEEFKKGGDTYDQITKRIETQNFYNKLIKHDQVSERKAGIKRSITAELISDYNVCYK